MSGSKKGSKRRPYRTAPKVTGYAHILFRTEEEAASDAFENPSPIEEWLSQSIESAPVSSHQVKGQ